MQSSASSSLRSGKCGGGLEATSGAKWSDRLYQLQDTPYGSHTGTRYNGTNHALAQARIIYSGNPSSEE